MATDLLVAFDTMDHNILLHVLRYKFNICGKALTWFDTYLHPRGCRVNVGKEYSSIRDITCSVPQGSICGPVLHLAYASTFSKAIPNQENCSHTLDLYGYADDHSVKNEFKVCKTNPTDENASVRVVEDCASRIKKWMDKNQLKMNDSKTEFITFASQRQHPKCNTTHLCVNGELVNGLDCIKYLGANLDQHLNFKMHAALKCQIAMYNLYKIRQIRLVLTEEVCRTIIQGLVLSHLEFANSILAESLDNIIKMLQRVQNMAAKVILRKNRQDSASTCLIKLHWLPIKEHIKHKVLTLVYNCLNNNAPDYLNNLLTGLPS